MTNTQATQISLMEIKLEDLTDCSDYSTDHFVTEASSIGLEAGQWPQNLKIDGLGNGRNFYAIKSDENGTTYLQANGCISITIFND